MFKGSLSKKDVDHSHFSGIGSGCCSGFWHILSDSNEVNDQELQETSNVPLIEVPALTAYHIFGSCSLECFPLKIRKKAMVSTLAISVSGQLCKKVKNISRLEKK